MVVWEEEEFGMHKVVNLYGVKTSAVILKIDGLGERRKGRKLAKAGVWAPEIRGQAASNGVGGGIAPVSPPESAGNALPSTVVLWLLVASTNLKLV